MIQLNKFIYASLIYWFFVSFAMAQNNLPTCEVEGVKHNCFGEVVSKNGTKYIGEWRNGKPDGEGTLISQSGLRYIGKFSEGGTLVDGTLYWPNGAKHVGKFLKGKPHGPGIQYKPDGSISVSGTWQEGTLQVAPNSSEGVATGQGTADKLSPTTAEEGSAVKKYFPDSVLTQLGPKLGSANIVLMSVGQHKGLFTSSLEIKIDDEAIDLKHAATVYRERSGVSIIRFRKQQFTIHHDDESIHLILASSPLIITGGQEQLSPLIRVLKLSKTLDKIVGIEQDQENIQSSARVEMKQIDGSIVSANRLIQKFTQDAELHASESIAQEDIGPNDEFVIDLQHHGLVSNMRRYQNGICQFWISADRLRTGDHLKFYNAARELKSKRCKEVVVDVAGPGGDFMSGIAIGYYIRRHGWSTAYGGWNPNIGGNVYLGCASSCFNIFLAGIYRYKTSQPLVTHLATDVRTNRCVEEDTVGAQMKRIYYQAMVGQYAKELYLDSVATPCKAKNSPLDAVKYGLFHGSKGFGPGAFNKN